MTTLEYEVRPRRWRFSIRGVAAIVAIGSALWIGTAYTRVSYAHRRLMRAIDAGEAWPKQLAPQLSRRLQWKKSFYPVLHRPWRQVILYYDNGYAAGFYVKLY